MLTQWFFSIVLGQHCQPIACIYWFADCNLTYTHHVFAISHFQKSFSAANGNQLNSAIGTILLLEAMYRTLTESSFLKVARCGPEPRNHLKWRQFDFTFLGKDCTPCPLTLSLIYLFSFSQLLTKFFASFPISPYHPSKRIIPLPPNPPPPPPPPNYNRLSHNFLNE